MRTVLLVALGGALGSVLRHLLGAWVREGWTGAFPLWTLAINVLGSFAMGMVVALLTPGSATFLFATAGLLGGFTTYSAFNQETLNLVESGAVATAMLYVGATLVGGLAAGFAGVHLGRILAR